MTGGVGGLWGTPAALVMNGGICFVAEVVAAARFVAELTSATNALSY